MIARDDVSRLVPVENAAMADRTVIQWDKDDLDTLGLIKVDVLALGMLSAIKHALVFIAQKKGRARVPHAGRAAPKTRRCTTCSAAPTASAPSRSRAARR